MQNDEQLCKHQAVQFLLFFSLSGSAGRYRIRRASSPVVHHQVFFGALSVRTTEPLLNNGHTDDTLFLCTKSLRTQTRTASNREEISDRSRLQSGSDRQDLQGYLQSYSLPLSSHKQKHPALRWVKTFLTSERETYNDSSRNFF